MSDHTPGVPDEDPAYSAFWDHDPDDGWCIEQPDVDGMSVSMRLAELGKRGYMLKPCPQRPSQTIALYHGDEYEKFGMPYSWPIDRLTGEFLREARRLDGDGREQ